MPPRIRGVKPNRSLRIQTIPLKIIFKIKQCQEILLLKIYTYPIFSDRSILLLTKIPLALAISLFVESKRTDSAIN